LATSTSRIVSPLAPGAVTAEAIKTMVVRGAPAIGIAAAYGYALAAASGEEVGVRRPTS